MSHSSCSFWIQDTTTLKPHTTKNRKILNHHTIGRLVDRYMTKISQGNKKITTRKVPATNNKIFVLTGSFHFFKKYRQPIITFWSVPVPARDTVCFFFLPPHNKHKFRFQLRDTFFPLPQPFFRIFFPIKPT